MIICWYVFEYKIRIRTSLSGSEIEAGPGPDGPGQVPRNIYELCSGSGRARTHQNEKALDILYFKYFIM